MIVSNWEKWQTFRKDRGTPPWIKVYRNLLSNEQWVELSDAEKGHLVSIWLLAADKGGIIPDSAKMIQKMCMLDEPPNLNKFKELGFVINDCQPSGNQLVTSRLPVGYHVETKKKKHDANLTHQSREEESREEESKDLSLNKFNDDHMAFAKGMYSLILKVAEREGEPDLNKWADVIRLMNTRDGYELSEMADVFRWANADDFWATNILSPTKFRKQYSALFAKMKSIGKTKAETITNNNVEAAKRFLDGN